MSWGYKLTDSEFLSGCSGLTTRLASTLNCPFSWFRVALAHYRRFPDSRSQRPTCHRVQSPLRRSRRGTGKQLSGRLHFPAQQKRNVPSSSEADCGTADRWEVKHHHLALRGNERVDSVLLRDALRGGISFPCCMTSVLQSVPRREVRERPMRNESSVQEFQVRAFKLETFQRSPPTCSQIVRKKNTPSQWARMCTFQSHLLTRKRTAETKTVKCL